MDDSYSFQLADVTDIDLADLEAKFSESAISAAVGGPSDRYHNLVDHSILIDIAHNALPAFAAWLAARRIKLKVERVDKDGGKWSIDLGTDPGSQPKSADEVLAKLTN